MNQTFLDVISNYNRKLGLSVNLFTKVLAWTEDYESAWYFIYDEIPKEVDCFWANRFGTYLYKFQNMHHSGWKMIEKGPSLTSEALRRIKIGPAFDHIEPILSTAKVLSWI